MLAVDLDQENTPNSQVLYFLVSQTPVLRESGFRIDRVSGEVRLSGCLDYEVMCTLLLWKNKTGSPSLSPRLRVCICSEKPSVARLATKIAKMEHFCIRFPSPVFEGFHLPFPPYVDGASVYTTHWSEGLWPPAALIHSHCPCAHARQQQPHAQVHAGPRKSPRTASVPQALFAEGIPPSPKIQAISKITPA